MTQHSQFDSVVEPDWNLGATPRMDAYCENCQEPRPFFIAPLKSDERNPRPWSDIVCKVCCCVITSISADEPGNYQFVKIEDHPALQ